MQGASAMSWPVNTSIYEAFVTSLTGGQADANKVQGFAIFIALVGTLRTCGATAPHTQR